MTIHHTTMNVHSSPNYHSSFTVLHLSFTPLGITLPPKGTHPSPHCNSSFTLARWSLIPLDITLLRLILCPNVIHHWPTAFTVYTTGYHSIETHSLPQCNSSLTYRIHRLYHWISLYWDSFFAPLQLIIHLQHSSFIPLNITLLRLILCPNAIHHSPTAFIIYTTEYHTTETHSLPQCNSSFTIWHWSFIPLDITLLRLILYPNVIHHSPTAFIVYTTWYHTTNSSFTDCLYHLVLRSPSPTGTHSLPHRNSSFTWLDSSCQHWAAHFPPSVSHLSPPWNSSNISLPLILHI